MLKARFRRGACLWGLCRPGRSCAEWGWGGSSSPARARARGGARSPAGTARRGAEGSHTLSAKEGRPRRRVLGQGSAFARRSAGVRGTVGRGEGEDVVGLTDTMGPKWSEMMLTARRMPCCDTMAARRRRRGRRWFWVRDAVADGGLAAPKPSSKK